MAAAWVLAGTGALWAGAVAIGPIRERRFPIRVVADTGKFDIGGRTYFDTDGQVRWDTGPAQAAIESGCETAPKSAPENWTQLLVGSPAVYERYCGPRSPVGRGSSLIGCRSGGEVAWERVLGSQFLAGASPQGLVLNSLEILDPATGSTLVPPRPRPYVATGRAALYVPRHAEVLMFDADVTIARREGGLYRVSAATGERRLWVPVGGSVLGSFLSVEDIALAADGAHVLLARQRQVRGNSPALFEVRELATGKVIYRHEAARRHACSQPQVAAAADGRLAFGYVDQTAGERVIVEYASGLRA